MTQRISRIVPVVAVLLLGATAAQAQPAPGPQGPGLERRRGPGTPGALTRMLGLSEDQQEKARTILGELRPQREALHEKMAANREALRELLESGSADANAVGELVLEGRRLHEESQAIHESQQKALRDILTPEQQKKFDAMQERRRERGPRRGPEGWQGKRGKGGPGAGGPRAPQGQPKPAQPEQP